MVNPGFEEGLKGWVKSSDPSDDKITASTDFARTGQTSLKLDGTTVTDGRSTSAMAFQNVISVKPNTMYYLTAWAKGGKAAHGSVKVAIKLEFYNKDGVNTSGVNGYHNLLENGEWDKLQVIAKTDPDTTQVKVYARSFDKTVAYFDDFLISQPDLMAVEPTRIVHVPNEETPVSINVVTSQPLTEKQRGDVGVLVENGGKKARMEASVAEIGDCLYQIKATLPPIVEGSFKITPFVGELESPVSVQTFPGESNRKPDNLSETGTILKDGKPFFPIGIYHPQNYTYYKVGGKSNGVETVGEDYDKIAQAGFNVVQGSSGTNLEEFGKYLDEAHKRGLLVDVPFYSGGRVKANLANSLEKVRLFKDHPAVLNWKISDEPDLRPDVMNEVPEVYWALKKADSKTPVEVTLATDNALVSWSNFMDIIQINRYPLPGNALTRVSDYTRLAVASKRPWQNVSYVVQSGWNKEGTEPTKDELRSMIYLALIEGAKGIWYYTMYDPTFDLTTRPIWKHIKGINEEVAKLANPVMLGVLQQDVTIDNASVHVRALEYEGELYVLLTNPERLPQSATLSLPEKWAKSKVSTLGGEALAMDGSAKLKLKLNPLESRALVFRNK